MIKKVIVIVFLFLFVKSGLLAQQGEMLIYHPIKTDKAGNIVPWYSGDAAIAYDHNLHTIWNFWFNMRRDMNGLPYYMNHQVWNANFDDPRGVGGDQFMMAISSWRLLVCRLYRRRKCKREHVFLSGILFDAWIIARQLQMAQYPFSLQYTHLFRYI